MRAGRQGGHPEAARISVLVTPRAASASIEPIDESTVRVRVTAAPADGAANAAVMRALAGLLGVAPRRLTIVSGGSARRKVVAVADMAVDELRTRLREGWAQPSAARRRSTAGRIPPAR